MIGDDFNTPIMYQDLANSTMGPMPYTVGVPMTNGYITGGYGRSLLGGAKMRRQLDNDKIEIMNQKEKQDKSTLKIALWVIGGALALGSIPVLRNSNTIIYKYILPLFINRCKKLFLHLFYEKKH